MRIWNVDRWAPRTSAATLLLVLGGRLLLSVGESRGADADFDRGFAASYPVDTFAVDGSVDIRDTAFPVPPSSKFVSTSGRDSNGGTLDAPWRTIAKALRSAPDGSTVVIRGGTYREGGLQLADRRLTLQPFPHEKVWMKGSRVVTGIVRHGGMWRKDGWSGFPQDTAAEAIDPQYPLAPHREMVFVDGKPLRQVRSVSQLIPGTFCFDAPSQRLYLGENPAGKLVEATVHERAAHFGSWSGDRRSEGCVVRGLGFAHYASGYQKPAVTFPSAGATVEDNTFAWNATSGAGVFASDAAVRGNTFAFNGQLGLTVNRVERLVLESNTFFHNNQERFSGGWEAGGVKITYTRDAKVQDNYAAGNVASHGIWFDLDCDNIDAVRNDCRHNGGGGIEYELSAHAVIASNLLVENDVGLIIRGSHDVDVYNNTFSGNSTGVTVDDDSRAQANPQITWDVKNVVLKNNLYADCGEVVLHVRDGDAPWNDAELLVPVSDYNAYAGHNTASGPMFSWWRARREQRYLRLSAFQEATGNDRHSLDVPAAQGALFADRSNGDYRLSGHGPAISGGEPLPPDVAAAIGVEAGVPVNVGRLR